MKLLETKIKNFSKHRKVFVTALRMRFMDQMEAGWAYFFLIIGTLLQLTINFLFFKILYLQVDAIGGWDYYQALVLLGIFNLVNVISWSTYRRGFNKLRFDIEKGDLDMFLCKPVNLRPFWSYFKISFIETTPLFILSVFLIIYGAIKSGSEINILMFLFLFVIGLVIHYSLSSIFASINFFKLIEASNYLMSEVTDLGKFPITIYKGATKLILSILLPILIIFSIPVQALFGQLDYQWMIITIVVAMVFYFIGKFIWKKGLDNYKSAQG